MIDFNESRVRGRGGSLLPRPFDSATLELDHTDKA